MRIALVIGNGRYGRARPLRNTHADAIAIAAALNANGFVSHKTELGEQPQALSPFFDQSLMGMNRLFAEFSATAKQADMAIIYYSGHGIEIDGNNYLIPVDAELAEVSGVRYETVPLEGMISACRGAKILRFVILDACRDNPFTEGIKGFDAGKSIGGGLASPPASGSTMVFYAAAAGRTAREGAEDGLSPFADALSRRLRDANDELLYVIGQVTDDVRESTRGAQEPQLYGALSGNRIRLSLAAANNDDRRASDVAGRSVSATPAQDLMAASTSAEAVRQISPAGGPNNAGRELPISAGSSMLRGWGARLVLGVLCVVGLVAWYLYLPYGGKPTQSFQVTLSNMPGNSGERYWSRSGMRWIERYPNGQTDLHTITGSITVAGCHGTLSYKNDTPQLEFFVPDTECPLKIVYAKNSNGEWTRWREMRDQKP